MSPIAAPIPSTPQIIHTGNQKPVEIIHVRPSTEEKVRGKLSDANIELLLSGMHRDGCVVLDDVIDPAHLDVLAEFMTRDAAREVQKPNHHKNFGVPENIQQGPPVHGEYFFDDVYLNQLLFHAVSLYLGPGAKYDFIQGNTAMPGGNTRQPVHSDAMGQHPPCPFYVVANIPTVTATRDNGATEIWLGGTHNYNGDHQEPHGHATKIREDVRDERAKVQPGQQPTVVKGSILVRDSRVWHAGMPNNSDTPRCMIGLGFSAAWRHAKPLRFLVPTDEELPERFYHGTKDAGVVPFFKEVPFEEYDTLRNSHDYYFPRPKKVDP